MTDEIFEGGRKPLRPLVLHVTADFPDTIQSSKTSVIRNLVCLTSEQFEHEVVSINRVQPTGAGVMRELVSPSPLRVEAECFEYGTVLQYHAPGKGLRHRTKLEQLGDWLVEHVVQMQRKPDLIIGHKLAIEGIAVRRASKTLGLPYGLSIQGDSDLKVIHTRRDLSGSFADILHGAKVVFPFAPWAWDQAIERLGEPEAFPIVLPCPTDLDQPLKPSEGGNGVLSVFHLKSYRRKNLFGMVKAMRLLAQKTDPPSLSIIGGGDASDIAACRAMIADNPFITLKGQENREAVRKAMNAASVFVLPSLRETFGLVFLEALFAGVPIIYPKGAAVDGYFDDAPFAIAVDARKPQSIAEAIEHAIARETEIKENLADWQKSEDMRRFQRDRIASAFSAGLMRAINIP